MSRATTTPPWTEAVREKDSAARREFLEGHVDLVRYLALRVSARLPSSADLDDLVHDGILGLIDSLERYDPARGVRFRTYAETRVRGAILDGLRQKDWRPRSVRHFKRSLETTLGELSTRHRRCATEEEIAEAMGIGVEEYRALLVDLNSGALLSLEDLPGGADPALPPDPSFEPHGSLERREMREVLTQEIDHIPERERRVLQLYYFERLNMREVGAVLGVTESRVCQLHAQAAARLRVALHRRFHVDALATQETG